jgi:hypothetical protein
LPESSGGTICVIFSLSINLCLGERVGNVPDSSVKYVELRSCEMLRLGELINVPFVANEIVAARGAQAIVCFAWRSGKEVCDS